MSSTSKTVWMVRPGRKDEFLKEFLERKIVNVGWDPVGDLGGASNKEDIRKIVAERSSYLPGKISSVTGQLYNFIFQMQPGHTVVTSDRERKVFHVGEIVSDYQYFPERTRHAHIRDVKWLYSVPRARLSPEAKKSLDLQPTVFKISDRGVSELIKDPV